MLLNWWRIASRERGYGSYKQDGEFVTIANRDDHVAHLSLASVIVSIFHSSLLSLKYFFVFIRRHHYPASPRQIASTLFVLAHNKGEKVKVPEQIQRQRHGQQFGGQRA